MDRAALIDVLEHTWPAEKRVVEGPFVFRKSNGGGKRVTATSVIGDISAGEIARAEARMEEMRQPRLFTLEPED